MSPTARKVARLAGEAESVARRLSFYFLAIPELPYEVIVGADFFQKWKVKLDPIAEDFIIDEEALKIMLV